jgi:hypothetical protein
MDHSADAVVFFVGGGAASCCRACFQVFLSSGQTGVALIKIDNSELKDPGARATDHCRLLEEGNILFIDHFPFDIPAADIEFLLSARQNNTRLHKNISYRPEQDVIRGASANAREVNERLREIMRNYSASAVRFLSEFLSPYAGGWQLDYASFRPIEEEGRELPLHKRNELLHVDAFPSRPTWGGRILRFFNNINPTEERVWEVGESFEKVAAEFARDAGLDKVGSGASRTLATASAALGKLGLPLPDRSQYDRFMLRFHDYLKENGEYQSRQTKTRLEFPPNSTWIVYTDCVPHSVLSGRFALEQTFIIPFQSLVAPESAPVSILERIAGRPLIQN